MSRWKVNEGSQVWAAGTVYVGGEEFDADESDLVADGARGLVTPASTPSARNKAVGAPRPSRSTSGSRARGKSDQR